MTADQKTYSVQMWCCSVTMPYIVTASLLVDGGSSGPPFCLSLSIHIRNVVECFSDRSNLTYLPRVDKGNASVGPEDRIPRYMKT